MKCSHGLPYESKCHQCVEDGLRRDIEARNKGKCSPGDIDTKDSKRDSDVCYKNPVDSGEKDE